MRQASRPSSNPARAGESPVVLTGVAAANDPDFALATPSVAAASATLMLATTLSTTGTGTWAPTRSARPERPRPPRTTEFGAVGFNGSAARLDQSVEGGIRIGGNVGAERGHGPH